MCECEENACKTLDRRVVSLIELLLKELTGTANMAPVLGLTGTVLLAGMSPGPMACAGTMPAVELFGRMPHRT